MKQRKIFIGISLSQQVKKRLSQKIKKWQNLPVKWIQENNFHITIFFIGYVNDEIITNICQRVGEITKNTESFEIFFERIVLAPNVKKPKMIWVEGKASEELKKIAEKIAEKIGMFFIKHRKFQPHITLGRLRAKKWATLFEKPLINEKFSTIVSVNEIEIFESYDKNGKRAYISIEKFPLK